MNITSSVSSDYRHRELARMAGILARVEDWGCSPSLSIPHCVEVTGLSRQRICAMIECRCLASVGVNGALDKPHLKFGEALEHRFLSQGEFENRPIVTMLDLGWDVLWLLPRDELHRVSDELLKQHYREKTAATPARTTA